VILLPELFETPYFCIEQDARSPGSRARAGCRESRPSLTFAPLARELGVVLPISFFEARRVPPTSIPSRSWTPTGATSVCYRKSHIPNGPGYQEKELLLPGRHGIQSVEHAFLARLGRGHLLGSVVSRDPRASWALMGAELFSVFRPRSAPSRPPALAGELAREHWQRTQQGHAAGESHPAPRRQPLWTRALAAGPAGAVHPPFYGSSFIADAMGARKSPRRPRRAMRVLIHVFGPGGHGAAARQTWFVFPRPGRPDLYQRAGVARRGSATPSPARAAAPAAPRARRRICASTRG